MSWYPAKPRSLPEALGWYGFWFSCWMMASRAAAQRGEINPARPSALAEHAAGYPGFFDTNLADEGSLVVEWPPILLPLFPIPSIAVDYGVTETLTVGTNAIVAAVPWLVGARGLSLKLRTLVTGHANMQSTATFYANYIGSHTLNSSWQLLTSNNAWKVNSRHIVSGQAMLMNLGLSSGSESDVDYTNLRLTSVAIGAGYQFLVSETAAISANLLVPGYTNIEADSVAANLNMNLDARSGRLLWGFGRASLDIRRDEWIYSIGGVYLYGIASGIQPWCSATTRW
jgi:hypothetical protein